MCHKKIVQNDFTIIPGRVYNGRGLLEKAPVCNRTDRRMKCAWNVNKRA
jgi:hypothetical protein